MTGYHITHIKDFMNKLLVSDIFDSFLLTEGTVVTATSFVLDGRLKKDFFSPEEWAEQQLEKQNYSFWRSLRPFCFELMKGKKTPLSFKFVFQLAPYNVEKLLSKSESSFTIEDIGGLVLTIRFEGGNLTCTTATSMKLFSLEKALDKEWDAMVSRFFDAHEIVYTIE